VFKKWVEQQAVGSQFGHFAGSKGEIQFLICHLEGRVSYLLSVYGSDGV
jgi:hypothetical protein